MIRKSKRVKAYSSDWSEMRGQRPPPAPPSPLGSIDVFIQHRSRALRRGPCAAEMLLMEDSPPISRGDGQADAAPLLQEARMARRGQAGRSWCTFPCRGRATLKMDLQFCGRRSSSSGKFGFLGGQLKRKCLWSEGQGDPPI